MWTLAKGFRELLDSGKVEVIEIAEARAQRLASDEKFLEALRMDAAERIALEYYRKLVEPVLGQDELHFEEVGEDTHGAYREPPRSELELLRSEVWRLGERFKRDTQVRRLTSILMAVTMAAVVLRTVIDLVLLLH
jgi:hypothetical protein